MSSVALLTVGILLIGAIPQGNAQERGLRFQTTPERTGNIATITAPITTEFGTYIPYRIPKQAPAIGGFEGGLKGDLSNAIIPGGAMTWDDFTKAERGTLARDQVMLRSEPVGTFAQAYNRGDLPPFVTLDAALNGLRVTTDEAWDQVRRNRLAPDLEAILGELSGNVAAGLARESDRDLREGLGRLLAWIETGRSLLDPAAANESSVATVVAAELDLVRRGLRAESPLLGRTVDYARMNAGATGESGELARYVAARRWLSEAGPRLGGSDDEAMMAALMARMVDALDTRSRERLSDIVALEGFFSGADERHLRLDAIAGGMRSWYGFQYDGGYGYLAESQGIDRVRTYMAEYRNRDVADAMQTGLLPAESRVGEGLIARAGSGVGLIEAIRSGGRTGGMLAAIPAEGWVRSNDAVALYTAAILAEQPEGGRDLPAFMRSSTWIERRGESALGAFAGFLAEPGVVDVVGRRSAARAVAAGNAESRTLVGYVEPDPAGWGAIASYAAYLRDGLAEGPRGRLIDSGLEKKLHDIENMSAQFMAIASAQLAGSSLSSDQRQILASAPAHIAAWENRLDNIGGLQITAGSAADGAKGPAVGHPQMLYALVPDGTGDYHLTRGAVYDYRETGTSNEGWVSELTGNGAGAVRLEEIEPVDGRITTVTPPLQKSSSRATAGAVQLDLEANVVSRSQGAVWFTVRAAGYDRTNIVATVVDGSGRTVYTSRGMMIENGERYDMIPTEDLRSGQYFVRISDITGGVLASGRFMIVR